MPAKRALLGSWADRGIAQPQDATSAAVVPLLGIEPGMRVLDRCSGMGTKTLQMREDLREAGSIVAIEPSSARCEALRVSLRTRGITNVQVRQGSLIEGMSELRAQQFDRILVDAPCSNSGGGR